MKTSAQKFGQVGLCEKSMHISTDFKGDEPYKTESDTRK